jgi:hypothetical protein
MPSPDALPPGPLHTYELEDGTPVPFYVIPFDRAGSPTAPQTRAHLLAEAASGGHTDIFLFSHGWNNDWTVATRRYQDFYEGYTRQRRERGDPLPSPYRPLLVGVFWPSTALAFGEAERGPAMANEIAVDDQAEAAAELAEAIPTGDRLRFLELTAREQLSEEEARELAALARPIYGADDEFGEDGQPSAEAILETWADADEEDEDDFSSFGTVRGNGAGPQAAGVGNVLRTGWLAVRTPVRLLTVYQMKTRAGTVGCHGVGPLLTDLLAASSARLHLVGHSYGGKVVLSALACGTGGSIPRAVESLLLLQPAVNHLCFAPLLRDVGRPGGYHAVPSRVRRPILATFSVRDSALHDQFHRIPWTRAAIGEPQIAGGGAPNRYAALGGYGPREAGEQIVDMPAPGAPYALDPDVPVYGLRANDLIRGHGDISNPATWWALYHNAFGGG